MLKRRFESNFESFLRFIIENSRYNSKAKKHFLYAAGGVRVQDRSKWMGEKNDIAKTKDTKVLRP